MANMDIYEKFRAVPQEAQKTITGGKLNGFTDINPMWRIKMLTEQFGACGTGWKTVDVRFWTETAEGETAAFCSLNLHVAVKGVWSEPIFGIGGSKLSGKGVGGGINDEAFKMAYTDAISIACKNLGMAADIYFSKDRTKYNSYQEDPSPAVQQRRRNRNAAKNAPETVSEFRPMGDELYWKVVRAYAEGRATKTGGNYRDEYIVQTHAGDDELRAFDADVYNYQVGHGLI